MKLFISLLLLLFLVSCGSSSSSSNENTEAATTPDVQSAMLKLHELAYPKWFTAPIEDSTNNYWWYMTKIDIGSDGDDDFIMFRGIDSHTLKERLNGNMLVFENHNNNSFTMHETEHKVFSHNREIVDVNNDGLEDILLHDHGYDQPPWGTDTHHLLIQNSDGTFTDRSQDIPNRQTRWHGITAIDIERDGDIDFISSGLGDGIFAYINDGTGKFTENISVLPRESFWLDQGQYDSFISLSAVDLNNDGYDEIIGGNLADGVILRNESGTFTFDNVTDRFSTGDFNQYGWVINGIKHADLDNDGCEDVVMVWTGNPKEGQIKIFKGNCDGTLVNTYTLPMQHDLGEFFPTELLFQDIDRNGLLDIAGGYGHAIVPVIYNFGNHNYSSNTHELKFCMSEWEDWNLDIYTALMFYWMSDDGYC